MRSRRAELVAAARTVFMQKGYQQTSMSEVIAASGLSAGAIYNHFSGKTEIMAAAARVDLSQFEARSDELPWEFVERCLVTLRDDEQLTRFLAITWGEAVTVPDVAEVVDEQLGLLRSRVVASYRAWAATELDFSPSELETWLQMLGSAVLSVLTGFVVQASTVRDFDAQSYFEFARTILRQA